MHLSAGRAIVGNTMFRSAQFRFAVIALFAVAAVSVTAVSARALSRRGVAPAGARIRHLLTRTIRSTISARARTHSVRMARRCSSAPNRAS